MFFFAKPRPAGVNLPSASKAIEAIGPLTVLTISSFLSGSPLKRTVSLLGVANVLISEKDIPLSLTNL